MAVRLLFFLVVCAVVLACALARTAQPNIPYVHVRLGVIPNTPRLVVSFNLTNPSASDELVVLNYGTPLEGVFGPIFNVFDAHGRPVPYMGKQARRMWPPSQEAYVTLAARESRSIDIDITDEYDFPGAGDYSIQFVAPHFTDDVIFAPSNIVIGRLPIIDIRRAREMWAPHSALGNTNCNSDQNTQITAAVKGAITETSRASSCLNAQGCNSLYTLWFGARTATNYAYAESVFRKVNTRLNGAPFVAYCNPAGCPSNVYAYVYPNDKTYTVYLCGAFWSEANERVNTVVHEMSHFTVLGGTQDYAYGKQACLNLAKSDPNKASHNADNVCYFSEEAK